MKIRSGMRSIEKSIRQQEKFAGDFVKNAQHAKKIGLHTANSKRVLEMIKPYVEAVFPAGLITKKT